jgi:CPA2 family monovalent cation:H+ antiporter-2
VGQNISRIIEAESIPYIAVDLELKRVQRATKEGGCHVIYGDATLYDILIACQIQRAAAVVISFDDANKASRILQQIRSHHNEIPIFVRAIDDSNLEKLQNLGATEVIPASLEASLMLASHLMLFMGIPISKIVNQIDHIRRSRYQLFHEVISTKESGEDFPIGCVIKITSNMYAAGKTIEELNLYQYKIYLTKIERYVQNDYVTLKPEPHLIFQLNDRITFYGPPSCVEQALSNLF